MALSMLLPLRATRSASPCEPNQYSNAELSPPAPIIGISATSALFFTTDVRFRLPFAFEN